ncbi:MAG: hypothetical protein ACI4QX_04785, partial [Lachnospiraceae bacterium]
TYQQCPDRTSGQVDTRHGRRVGDGCVIILITILGQLEKLISETYEKKLSIAWQFLSKNKKREPRTKVRQPP